MNRIHKKRNSSYALAAFACVAAFVYSYNAAERDSKSDEPEQTDHSANRSSNLKSRDSNNEPGIPTARFDSPSYTEQAASEVPIDEKSIASSFLYSKNEIRSELVKSFGSETPSLEQINRRHVEKFLSYGRQVSLFAAEQTKLSPIQTAAEQAAQTTNSNTDPVDGSASKTQNPYLALRASGVTGEQSKSQDELNVDSAETRSERYIRQAEQSAGRQL